VLRFAAAAAEQAAASGAHREAAAQYARALRFADGLSPERRAELFARRADECYLTAQIEEAIAAQEGALECQQLGNRCGEGDALRSLSRLLFLASRASEGEATAVEAVELLERLPAGHELAMAYGNASQRRMVVEDVDGAMAWGTRALELAERLDDTEAIGYALTNLGSAQTILDPEEGQAKLERALALAQRHGFEEQASRAFFVLVLWPLRSRKFEPTRARPGRSRRRTRSGIRRRS
jgi:hypothetical protein